MMVYIIGDLFVNPDEVSYITADHRFLGDEKEKTRVVIIVLRHNPTLYIKVVDDFDVDVAVAKLNGTCVYRNKWLDEVGDIDICLIHDNNSAWGPEKGPNRPCLTKEKLS